jgi:hypothetical protein
MSVEISTPQQEVRAEVNWLARLQAVRWLWLPTTAFFVKSFGGGSGYLSGFALI